MSSEVPTETHYYTVSELNLAVRALLDEAFDSLWIQGEISNFACPRSGHWYFTLKDEKSQVRAAMFKGANYKVGFQPEDGMLVSVLAKAGLYPERGDYQLIVEQLQSQGEGALQKAFEALKKKLSEQGLFDPALKKTIPAFVSKIGIISSATGAALQDILSVLSRRFPLLEVFIYPCMVQGAKAAPTIINAIKRANRDQAVDVLILARGGGSLEDLWPFNEERVALSVFESKIPIISAIGHETDFTICDFVADLRAPTPSAAAECASPDQVHILRFLSQSTQKMQSSFERMLAHLNQKIDHLEKRLGDPREKLKSQGKQLERIGAQLNFLGRHLIDKSRNRLHHQTRLLTAIQIKQQLLSNQSNVLAQQNLAKTAVIGLLNQSKSHFSELGRALHTLSPLATLERGYSISFDNRNKPIHSVAQLKIGQGFKTRLSDGIAFSVIESIDRSNSKTG